mmetsp:Transcript_56372/g.99005  ORF Transcript_56372/g.99005 Transcript_56372/m.99005 type:complete len:231 (-) Transcript_56372:610-1302(-)
MVFGDGEARVEESRHVAQSFSKGRNPACPCRQIVAVVSTVLTDFQVPKRRGSRTQWTRRRDATAGCKDSTRRSACAATSAPRGTLACFKFFRDRRHTAYVDALGKAGGAARRCVVAGTRAGTGTDIYTQVRARRAAASAAASGMPAFTFVGTAKARVEVRRSRATLRCRAIKHVTLIVQNRQQLLSTEALGLGNCFVALLGSRRKQQIRGVVTSRGELNRRQVFLFNLIH